MNNVSTLPTIPRGTSPAAEVDITNVGFLKYSNDEDESMNTNSLACLMCVCT